MSLGWRALDNSRTGRALVAGAALLALFTLTFFAREQMAVWRDSYSLWTRASAAEPSLVAHMNLGSSLPVKGRALLDLHQ